jgi:hypothetical protein
MVELEVGRRLTQEAAAVVQELSVSRQLEVLVVQVEPVRMLLLREQVYFMEVVEAAAAAAAPLPAAAAAVVEVPQEMALPME